MTKIETFRSHISGVCSSCFYHMRDLWRIRRHLDLLLCPVVLIIATHFCLVSPTLPKASACSESTDPLGDKVSSIYSQCSTASFSSLVASKA